MRTPHTGKQLLRAAAVALCLLHAVCGAEPPRFDRYVPGDAVLFAHVGDVPALLQRLAKTPCAGLVEEPQVRVALGRLAPELGADPGEAVSLKWTDDGLLLKGWEPYPNRSERTADAPEETH